jgi:thymidylate kinase
MTRSGRRDRGRTITVAGPDGAGKTTFCDAFVATVLAGEHVRRVHHRFGLLPARDGGRADPTRPHAQAPYPWGVSHLKVVFLFAEYVLAWAVSVRRFVRRGNWLIIERGWWDLAVDPRRYRLRSHRRLVGWLGRLLPAPDLVVVLEAPVEVLAARKDEVAPAELARQVRAWHDVLPRRVKRLYLDVSRSPEELVARAAEALERCAPPLRSRSSM